jgi:serine/threonine-protein kinase
VSALQLETLAGRYRLVEVIGRGGMSTVYRAVDAKLRRTVAVKVLSPALADADPVSLARFEREAQAAAGLAHPSIVAVYDTAVDGDIRFIVMEYVPGHSLDEVLRSDGRLEPAHAVYIAEQVASALAVAHGAGIVHRDIKPGNVMVTDDGAVKVLDFGIARAVDGSTLTHTSSVVGTAAYMSPEQAAGRRADDRADIYSLGCLLYTMLTGGPPFTGEVSAAVLGQHLHAEPPSPRDANPEVPPALDALVMQMLAKDPDARPQTAFEVRDRLAQVLTGAPAALAETAPTGRLAGEVAPEIAQTPESASHRGAVVAGAVGAVALVAALLALAGSGSHHAATTSSPATSARSAPPATSAAPTTSTRAPATTTVTTTAPATTQPSGKSKPPGQGGEPPGQAKKQSGKKGGG